MSNPALPPLPPLGFDIPDDIQGNLTSLLARMLQRGMAEVAVVMGAQANYTLMPSGKERATSRRHVALGTLPAVAITVLGQFGQEALAQEGVRASTMLRAYWQPSAQGPAFDLVTEVTYTDRWLVLPQRNPAKEWRIAECAHIGAYYYAILDAGGTGDLAGNIKSR